MNSRPDVHDEHVVDQVQDVLLGRIDAAASRRIYAHLAVCDACAADYAFALRLRDASMTEPVDPSLAQFLDTVDLPTAGSAPVRRVRRLAMRPTRVVVSFMAAAAALLLLLRPWAGDDFAAIARLEPLPVRLTREAPAPDSFDEARLQALGAYRDGDYATALTHCERALHLRVGDGEMHIYAASAEALLQRLPAAAQRLDALIGDAQQQPAAIVREARWQRAQVALLDGEADRARVELEFLVREAGIRQQEARVQLEQI